MRTMHKPALRPILSRFAPFASALLGAASLSLTAVTIGTVAAVTTSCAAKRPQLPQINAEQRAIIANFDLVEENFGDTRTALVGTTEDHLTRTVQKLYFVDVKRTPELKLPTGDQLTARPFYKLAYAGADDYFVFTGKLKREGEAYGYEGHVSVWNVMLGRKVVDEPLAAWGRNAEAFSDELGFAVQKVMATKFSEPGSYPRTDPVKAADALEKSNEFYYAQRLYAKAISQAQGDSTFERRTRSEIKRKLRSCETEMRKRGIEFQDPEAEYSETITFSNINEAMQPIYAQAFAQSGLSAGLKKVTTEPVEIFIQRRTASKPGRFPAIAGTSIHVMTMFSEGYYRRGTRDEDAAVAGLKAVSLNPYAEVMQLMLNYRARLIELAPPERKKRLEKATWHLHLARASDDRIVIPVTARSGGRPAAPSELTVWLREYEGYKMATVDAEATERTGYFLLPLSVTQMNTSQKYLLEFLGLVTLTQGDSTGREF